jgi:Tol biopolymer transport system component
MPLAPGTRLGPYEVVAPLGAGGMGEVYRARDSRLGRDVAVKVLPAELAGNPERRARLEREARAVSGLNHPNICVLHDVGREGDVDFLVMELVEGETLAQRIEKGPFAPAELLRVGAQIADALDRAHRAGIVHRDLKPGNVMLTRAGAKLMDFGLARAAGAAGSADGPAATAAIFSQSPTASRPLTAEGTVVGTFQYMAPEQLEGHDADARSDLWAFGCVLYEMATGRRAFEGKSQASLIGAIMHAEPPPPSQLVAASPPALDRLIRACLAKDPADRLQSAHDLKLQLAWMAEGGLPASGVAALPPPAAARRTTWGALALVALGSAAISVLATARWVERAATTRTAATMQRYTVGSADLRAQSAPVLSPDGTYLVFSVNDGISSRLVRRDLASFETTPIAGTEEGLAPFFSPDGAWIGFATPDALKKVPAGGGVAQSIAAEPKIDSADWGRDGTIYFTSLEGGRDGRTALARVADTGGRPEVVAVLDTTAAESESWLPEILPDGRVLVTLFGGSAGMSRIVVVDRDGTRRTVVEDALLSRYVPSGSLLYFDFGSEAVLAAPFDVAGARVTGPAVPLTEKVDGDHGFDVAPDGKLVYVPARGALDGEPIVWIDRKGGTRPALAQRSNWTEPRLSPDGRRVVLRKIATNCELWMYDLERETLSRIVQGDDNHHPVWSPDGRRIAYEQFSGAGALVTLDVSGTREMTTLASGLDHGSPRSWSAAGDRLAYTVSGRGTGSDIWVRAMDRGTAPTAFRATEAEEGQPAFSPDGRWMAYTSDETGTPEVFVRAYPDDGQVWQISAGGGADALWARDGTELYYVAGTKMMAVPVETRPGLRVGVPTELFDGGFSTSRSRDFDVAADGRFLAVGRAEGKGGGKEIRILLGWEAEVRRVGGPRH